ncbi:MAG: PEGA domain-containing protein [Calditrichaeota bacterium]|nr:PEGA domain-containing protein [Calditrichota bacterium]
MRRLLPFVALPMALLFGCATILTGTSQNVNISSAPAKARVTIDTRYMGETPVVAELKKGENHTILVEMEGYETAAIAVSKSVNGWWIVGDVVLMSYLFWLGLGIDFATGAIYKLTPDNIDVNLRKTIGASMEGGSLTICVIMNPDPSWVSIGQLKPLKH